MTATVQSYSELNSLSVEVYDLNNVLINDPDRDLKRVTIDGFRKQFPGGVYADGSLRVARNLRRSWAIRGAQRVVLRHSHEAAYEGYIGDVGYTSQNASYVALPLMGATEALLMLTTSRKLFADNRVDESTWNWDTAASGEAKCTIDRNGRLRHVPKNVQWGVSDYAQVIYTEPTGQTARRIKGSYQLQEGGQAWKIEIYRSTDGSAWTLEYTIATASGSGTFDRTMGTATRYIAFRFSNDSGGNQTPAADGSIFGEIYNIMVYTTIAGLTSNITMETVARWLAAAGAAATPAFLNSDTQYIQSPATALTVEPYFQDTYAMLSDLIDDIVAKGDGDLLRWAWGLYDSERAASPDGLPAIFLKPYPLTTDGGYDYTIDWNAMNMSRRPTLVRSLSSVYNWIDVSRRDEKGNTVWITPLDDANLKDDTSIAKNRVRAIPGGVDVGERSAVVALSFGKRLLATSKDVPWRLTTPLGVSGYILDSNGMPVPACMIEPGKRVRVTGGPVDDDGNPPVFVITATDYKHRNRECSIATGEPLSPLLPMLAAELSEAWQPTESVMAGGGSGGGGAGPGRLNFYKTTLWKQALALGLAVKDQLHKLTAKEKKALKKQVRKRQG